MKDYLITEEGKVVGEKDTQEEAVIFAQQRVTNSVRPEHNVEIYRKVGTIACSRVVTTNIEGEVADASNPS